MAHKKGQSSSKNGRDSKPKMLGVKVFGGEVVRDFSFSFSIGVVIGTYSSIFVASSLVYEWNRFFKIDFKKYGLSKKSFTYSTSQRSSSKLIMYEKK